MVDDSKLMRAYARINLVGAGFSVAEIDPTSVIDVLEAIHQLQPRLVLMDYEMPACNGESLLRIIREDTGMKDTPVMVMSAHGETNLVRRLERWGLAGYLLKPVRPEELIARGQAFFEAHRQKAL